MSDQPTVKVRTALISVSNKNGLVDFTRSLIKEFGMIFITYFHYRFLLHIFIDEYNLFVELLLLLLLLHLEYDCC